MNKKHQIFIIFFLIFLFVFCNKRYFYKADFSLTSPQVLRPQELIFSDSIIDIHFIINTEDGQISFILYNKFDKMIKINWDEISFIDLSGEANRILPTGVRFIERDAPRAPIVVPPKTKLNDAITPIRLIKYSSNGWETSSLFEGYQKEEIENKEISIYFPIEISEEKKEYIFTFKISNVIEESDTSTTNINHCGCLGPIR